VTVRVAFRDRKTRLEQAREIEGLLEYFANIAVESEAVWEQTDKSADARRDACLNVFAPATQILTRLNGSQFVRDRLNDVLVAFDELRSGRHSVLLAPAPVHPGTPSVTDLGQQAMAQVCVDILRTSGLSAADARKATAGLLEKYKLPKFSESKLRAIGSRLKGAGATQDPAYDLYQWAARHADNVKAQLGIREMSRSRALKLADILVGLTKNRDHRRDFFFAPGEDSSEVP
jgi:hypothetical protein